MTSQDSFGTIPLALRYGPPYLRKKSLKNLPSRYGPPYLRPPFFSFHGTAHRTLINLPYARAA